MSTAKTGVDYILIQAKRNPLVGPLLEELRALSLRGDVVLYDQTRRTLDDVIFCWRDGDPACRRAAAPARPAGTGNGAILGRGLVRRGNARGRSREPAHVSPWLRGDGL